MITIKISERLAYEMETWAQGERRVSPPGTAYQEDLADLLRQLHGGTVRPDDEYGQFVQEGCNQ